MPTHSARSMFLLLPVAITLLTPQCHAGLISVTNAGFEDISGETQISEFTFGPLNGWDLYDPNGVAGTGAGPTFFIGTLSPFAPFFTGGAPEGQRVAIAFNFLGSGDTGEYGLQQTLTESLQANTNYTLDVDIGNIASGTAVSGQNFELSGFPGYRVDILAGGVIVAQDNNSLAGLVPDGEFATSTISFSTAATHSQLGQLLEIRLVNLNQTDPSHLGSDLEVDFDNIRFNSSSVPEPNSLTLIGLLTFVGGLTRRKRRV